MNLSRTLVVLVSAVTLLIVAGILFAVPTDAQGPAFGATYVKAEACKTCHTDIYNTFMKSGHPWKVNKVVDGKPPVMPFTKIEKIPEGYTWNDISYVIGGYSWKYRFMDKQGYIITDKPGAAISDTNYLNQWNYANAAANKDAAWSKYNSGVSKLKYDCGTCHTTGYKPTGNQDNLPGIVGTWSETGIQCEACHGPGSLHVANPYGVALKVDRDAELCGTCHRRSDVTAIDAKSGLIDHHEQYEEMYQSKHLSLKCVDCHNPHAGVVQLRQDKKQTTRTLCENCHFKEARNQASAAHLGIKVACIDCHMPRMIGSSASVDAAKFVGDIRVHMFAIDPDATAQFSADGKLVVSQITLDFACKSCHVQGGKASVKTNDELKAKAKNYHAPK